MAAAGVNAALWIPAPPWVYSWRGRFFRAFDAATNTAESSMATAILVQRHPIVWRDPPVWPFLWRGLVPLAALAAVTLYALGPVRPQLDPAPRRTGTARAAGRRRLYLGAAVGLRSAREAHGTRAGRRGRCARPRAGAWRDLPDLARTAHLCWQCQRRLRARRSRSRARGPDGRAKRGADHGTGTSGRRGTADARGLRSRVREPPRRRADRVRSR